MSNIYITVSKLKKKEDITPDSSKRILFFDVLRISSILAIVIFHICQYIGIKPFNTEFLFLKTIYIGIGPLAVFVLIFVSGAVLEYTYDSIKTWKQHALFYIKRFIRLYPAWWISLLVGILFTPILIRTNLYSLLRQFFGVSVYFGEWGGSINTIGWFIGVIMVLYLAFPFMSKIIKKYPSISIISFTALSFLSMYLVNIYLQPLFPKMILICRWFPTVNLFAFALGIFIVQQKLYPKITHNIKSLTTLSEFTFYIFLVHNIFYSFILKRPQGLPQYIMIVIAFSLLLMTIDRFIQKLSKKYIKI
jgi:peptidoglycan/LPS O-acetylase OafA/YrhL